MFDLAFDVINHKKSSRYAASVPAFHDALNLITQVAKEWGRAVLMVTHDPRIAAHADRIIFLKDGKLVNETQLEAGPAAGNAVVAGALNAAVR